VCTQFGPLSASSELELVGEVTAYNYATEFEFNSKTVTSTVTTSLCDCVANSPVRDTGRVMSDADAVELVRRYSDAVVRRDFNEVERCVTPNVCFVTAASGTLEGRAAVRALVEDIVRPFETFAIDEGEEVRSLGNGVVLAVFFTKGRMVGGVGELRSPFASVSLTTDGLIEWHAHYTDADDARAAAERLAQERADG